MRNSKIIGYILGALWTVSASAQVVQDSLPTLTAGTIGTSTELTAHIWGDKPDADSVIQQIRDCADMDFNLTELNILRQVLLTDVGGIAALEEKNEAYLQARLETLLRQGLFEEVLGLVGKMQKTQQTNLIKQLRAEALFSLGRVQEVCRDDVLSAFGDQEGFLRVICADALQTASEPALAYEVYREREGEEHPFLNAAGDILFRNLSAELPTGEPSVWEMPILAKAFGDEVFQLPLNRQKLWTLIAHEQVPQEVRLRADKLVNADPPVAQPDGQVLAALIQMAKARQALEKNLPIALWQKRTEIKRAE